jgi:hypothetical protein
MTPTKRIQILWITLIIAQSLFAQRLTNPEDYKHCIMQFYCLLYKDSITKDLFFRHLSIDSIKTKKLELTQNFNYEEIKKIVDNYRAFDDGIVFCEYGILTFPNNKKIYFLLGREYPPQIGDIWLNDCSFIGNPCYFLEWRAIINSKDPSDIENVYEFPDIKSRVVKKISTNQTFSITPIDNKDWYRVYEHGVIYGYIRKNHVLLFPDFPKSLKEKIIKDAC